MARNVIPNFFQYSQDYVNKPRSVFNYHRPVKANYLVGRFTPLGAPIFVLPGDTFSLNIEGLLRSGTLAVPYLDDMYVDVIATWVPLRNIWTHYFQWLGENDTTAWTQTNQYDFPSLEYYGLGSVFAATAFTTPDDVEENDGVLPVDVGNYFLAPHFGLPYQTGRIVENAAKTGYEVVDLSKISALEFRAYYFTWNEIMRDPNWQRPVLFSKGDDGTQGEFGYVLDSDGLKYNVLSEGASSVESISFNDSGTPLYPLLMPVNRFHDSATSILPQPQAGDPVSIAGFDGEIPVVAGKELHDILNSKSKGYQFGYEDNPHEYKYYSGGLLGIGDPTGSPSVPGSIGFKADLDNEYNFTSNIEASNMVIQGADIPPFTINAMRSAILFQEYKEMLARGGQRAADIIRTFFGVNNSALLHDKVEILCHKRFLIGVNQVVATADTTNGSATSHLGDTGAYSVTGINSSLFTKSFSEHGYIVICLAIRQVNSYSQGIPEQFMMLGKFENYWTCFDHIGEQPFKARFIQAESPSDLVLGYQEAWYWLRTQRPVVVGSLDPAIYGSENWWTLGTVYDAFTAENSIGPGFFIQGPQEFDRVLVADHTTQAQYKGDMVIKGKMARRMSAHSVPLMFGRL